MTTAAHTKWSENGRQASLQPPNWVIDASFESSHHLLTILRAKWSPVPPKRQAKCDPVLEYTTSPQHHHPTKRSENGRHASLRPSNLAVDASLESSHHFLTILEAILSPTKPKVCPWSDQTSEGAGFACFFPYHRDARENH